MGQGVEVDEAEPEVRVRRRVEEPGGEEARVEAAEGAEEGGGGKGAARGEAPQEDGALVGQRGDGGRRWHSVVAWLGKPGALRAAPPWVQLASRARGVLSRIQSGLRGFLNFHGCVNDFLFLPSSSKAMLSNLVYR